MDFVALDIETDGLNTVLCNIIGIGVYSPKGQIYIRNPICKDIEQILHTLGNRKLVLHNGVFDAACIYHRFSIDIAPFIGSDTMLLQHTINENAELSLDEMSKQHLGEDFHKHTEILKESVIKNGGKYGKGQKDIYLADPEIIEKYCLRDCELTYKLNEKLLKEFENQLQEKLYFEEVMPLYTLVTIPMKYHGICVDVPYFENLRQELDMSIKGLEFDIRLSIVDDVRILEEAILDDTFRTTPNSVYGKELKRKYGEFKTVDRIEELLIKRQLWEKKTGTFHQFNINSNKQIGWLLFDQYGEKSIKDTKGGQPCVDAKTLKYYSHVPFVEKLLALRKEQKLLSTYVLPILEKQIDGKIYCDFNQWGTTSGRYSSSAPNVQNLPRKDMRIRQGIIAPRGYKIIDSDFSSLEPHCFAEVSNCSKLIEAYKKGEDLYSRAAIDIFKLENVSAHPEDENYLKKVDATYRDKMKEFCLAVVYGIGKNKLARVLGVDKREAQRIIDLYLDIYPELKTYMDKQEEMCITTGTITTRYGRIRHVPEVLKLKHDLSDQAYWKLRNYLNLSKNHPIQGFGAHICNHAMIKFAKTCPYPIVQQVHDEIVVYAPEQEAEKVAKLLQDAMENNVVTQEMRVPIAAVPVICNNLKEAK